MADIAEFRGARRNPQVETMAYAGEVPWHNFGKFVGDKAVTSDVMLVEAGMDWDVELGPIYGPNMEPIPGWQSVYRVTDSKVFGVSRGRYEVVNNRDAFAWCDSLVEDGVARYNTAGSLLGGARTWVLMEMEEGWSIGNEEYRNYLLVFNGFDLNTALTAKYVNERVVCRNTAMIALAEQSLTFRTTHSRGVKERLEAAREMFRVTTEAQRHMREMLEKLQTVKLSESQQETVVTGLFGTLDEDSPTRRKNAVETFKAIYEAEQALNGDSMYTMFNTVTGYADHKITFKGKGEQREESRFRSILAGPSQEFKAKAMDIMTDIEPELKEFAGVV